MTFNADHSLETYKSLISISVELLKSMLLLNGGAIVALLVYLGQAANGPPVVRHATFSLAWFIAGLVLSALAFIGSYLTQLSLYNEGIHPDKYKGSHMPWLWSTFGISFFKFGFLRSRCVVGRCGAIKRLGTLAFNPTIMGFYALACRADEMLANSRLLKETGLRVGHRR